MSRPPFYHPPDAALPREPAIADQGHGDNDREQCEECSGWGWFTDTVEGQDGSDVSVDYVCKNCNGTGEA